MAGTVDAEAQKRIKGLRKKLSQIEKLKEKGDSLSPEEAAKIEGEASIIDEIRSIERGEALPRAVEKEAPANAVVKQAPAPAAPAVEATPTSPAAAAADFDEEKEDGKEPVRELEPVEAEKKIKTLKKKLGQISKLQERGPDYTKEEAEKIASEEKMLTEVQDLEIGLLGEKSKANAKTLQKKLKDIAKLKGKENLQKQEKEKLHKEAGFKQELDAILATRVPVKIPEERKEAPPPKKQEPPKPAKAAVPTRVQAAEFVEDSFQDKEVLQSYRLAEAFAQEESVAEEGFMESKDAKKKKAKAEKLAIEKERQMAAEAAAAVEAAAAAEAKEAERAAAAAAYAEKAAAREAAYKEAAAREAEARAAREAEAAAWQQDDSWEAPAPTAAAGELAAGQVVEAKYGNGWFPAVVVEDRGGDRVNVRYDYDGSEKELGRTDVRATEAAPAAAEEPDEAYEKAKAEQVANSKKKKEPPAPEPVAPKKAEAPAQPAPAKAEAPAPPAPAKVSNLSETEKRMRNLKKKIAQIDKLKARGGDFTPEEEEKLSSEAETLAEMRALEKGETWAPPEPVAPPVPEPVQAPVPEPVKPAPAPAPAEEKITDPAEAEKKIKALNKKLVQIAKLKEKSELSPEETGKVASEKQMRKDIARLEKLLK